MENYTATGSYTPSLYNDERLLLHGAPPMSAQLITTPRWISRNITDDCDDQIVPDSHLSRSLTSPANAELDRQQTPLELSRQEAMDCQMSPGDSSQNESSSNASGRAEIQKRRIEFMKKATVCSSYLPVDWMDNKFFV